jgi:hypothetical protein
MFVPLGLCRPDGKPERNDRHVTLARSALIRITVADATVPLIRRGVWMSSQKCVFKESDSQSQNTCMNVRRARHSSCVAVVLR